MADTLKLDILTPAGAARPTVEVAAVEIPGLLGEIGAGAQHEPFITAVKPGVVRFRDGSDSVRVAVGGGFLELTAEGQAILLVDRAVDSADVDAEAARADLDEARKALAELRETAIDDPAHKVASQRAAWAEALLRAAGESRI